MKIKARLLISLAVVMTVGGVSSAQVPSVISYQGRVQVGGNNFLLPVEAAPKATADLNAETISLDSIVKLVAAKSRVGHSGDRPGLTVSAGS